MAAALLKDKVARLGQEGEWEIASAGTWAEPGLPATPLASAEMARRGLDISQHRTRSVDADMLRTAPVALVMTRSHRESLRAEFPESAHKIVLFSELAGQTYDIEDPVGGGARDYQLCADDLARITESGFDRLAALAEVNGDRVR